jgi:S1-C subfamily serine protease
VKPRRFLIALALLAAALALAACGGDGDGGSGGGSNGPGTGNATFEKNSAPGRHVAIETAAGTFNPAAIYERVSPGVVTILSVLGQSPVDVLGGGGAAQGSGFVISDDGEIATNAHVVTDAEAAGGSGGTIHVAKEVYVQFADRNKVRARVVGFDPFADVALLKVDPGGLDLAPVSLGSTEDVEIGDPVAAIGSPFGQDQSLSTGIVSATDRSIDSLTKFSIDGAIQTDASINPGNSGGPLLDADGRVIGIDQQINTTSGGNEGVGFAVPIDLAKRSLRQLEADGTVEYAYLGVSTQSLYPQLANRLNIDSDTGALVSKVIPGSPADDAGIEPGSQEIQFQGARYEVGGDVITAVNGEQLTDEADLPRLISLLDPGDKVKLDVIRDGKHETVEVTLGTRPADQPG